MIHIPIIGGISAAGGTILQKVILRKRKISPTLYNVLEFLSISIVMLPLLCFFWGIEPSAFEPRNILIFFSIVFLSFIANLFTFYSMKWEKVSNLEPAKILEPLFVVLLAISFSFIIDGNIFERDLKIIIPAIIAGLALIFSHIKKHHLKFNKYFLAAILGSFFFAFELILSRLILDYYTPITFYFIRCIFLLGTSAVILRPKFVRLKNRVKLEVLGIGILWTLYRVMTYYGYQKLGVISTTLVLMIAPIFVYIFAWKFLKEKISWRNIVASIIILACVLYTIIY